MALGRGGEEVGEQGRNCGEGSGMVVVQAVLIKGIYV